MSIEVNGHKLPPLLVKLIEDGKWIYNKSLPDNEFAKLLKRVGLPVVGLAMLDIEFIQRQVPVTMCGGYDEWYQPWADASKFASSKLLGKPIKDFSFMDVENFLIIALNMDEDYLGLDYRRNPDNPPVVTSGYVEGSGYNWTVIAPDFETFARELGLVE